MITTSSQYNESMREQFRLPANPRIITRTDFLSFPLLVLFYPRNHPLSVDEGTNLINHNFDRVHSYASCEKEGYILGKRQLVVPTNFENTFYQGFVGENISDENGEFDSDVYVNLLDFGFESLKKDIPKMTLVFDDILNRYPKELQIIYYGDEDIFDRIYQPDSPRLTIEAVKDVRGIIMFWKKTSLPFQRPLLSKILFGDEVVFDNKDLSQSGGIKIINDIDPISRRLPIQNITFNIIDENNKLVNSEMWENLITNFPLKIRFNQNLLNGSTEIINGGSFYLDTTPRTNKQIINFTAVNQISLLTNDFTRRYTSNFTQGINLKTLSESILEINDTFEYKIDNILSNYVVNYIPSLKVNDLLKTIAEASQCILYEDENGFIRIEPTPDNVQDYKLDFWEMYDEPRLEKSSLLRNLIVTIYNYTVESSLSEIGRFYIEPSTKEQSLRIDEAIDMEITGGPGTTGFIDGLYIGLLVISPTTFSGEIIVKGKKIITNEIKKVYNYNSTGEDEVVNNPFITTIEHADKIAKWKSDYLQLRNTYYAEYRGDPILRPPYIINAEVTKDKIENTRILKSELNWNGSYKGNLIIKGDKL